MRSYLPKPDDPRVFYESLNELYPQHDRWHCVTHDWIVRVVADHFKANQLGRHSILNLGSGGQSYGLTEHALVHVDVHRKGFTADQRLIVADIQDLPDFGRTFEHCICVGSVINHCDAGAVLEGVNRALRPGGSLLLEFESSYSFEFLFTQHFRAAATVAQTVYQGQDIRLWMYAPRYIESLVETFGMTLCRCFRKHIISPAIYRLWPNANIAANFHVIDPIARLMPLINMHAHNVIFLCRRLE